MKGGEGEGWSWRRVEIGQGRRLEKGGDWRRKEIDEGWRWRSVEIGEGVDW